MTDNESTAKISPVNFVFKEKEDVTPADNPEPNGRTFFFTKRDPAAFLGSLIQKLKNFSTHGWKNQEDYEKWSHSVYLRYLYQMGHDTIVVTDDELPDAGGRE